MPAETTTDTWNPLKSGTYSKQVKTTPVYGPVNSRRLGLSLGINTVQGGFLCNWGCVYCQYGAVGFEKQLNNNSIRFSTPQQIKLQLERRLQEEQHFDSITICGATDPSLSPYLQQIIDLVVTTRNNRLPRAATSLFTNATNMQDISLTSLDYVFLKLDCGNQETFKRFNRPHSTSFEKHIEQLQSIKTRYKIIQTALVGGKDGNIDNKNLQDYVKSLITINPDEVHVYPILYKPPPKFDVQVITQKQLDSLAKTIQAETNIHVRAFYNPTSTGEFFDF